MKILVTNDDGFFTEGIKLLATEALKYGDVKVVAPQTEQSGKSQSVNFRNEIAFKKETPIIKGVETFSVGSTPADCVKVARIYLNYDFDIVFSGINDGYNLGEDINYSGTVGAILEARNFNKKGIAFSMKRHNFFKIEDKLSKATQYIFENNLLSLSPLWNVNFPENENKGIKLTNIGNNNYTYQYTENNGFLKVSGLTDFQKERNQKSDIYNVKNGFTSLTPLIYDRTDEKTLKK